MNSVQAIKVEIVRKMTLFEVLEFNYISCVNFIETMSQLTRWPFQIQKLLLIILAIDKPQSKTYRPTAYAQGLKLYHN